MHLLAWGVYLCTSDIACRPRSKVTWIASAADCRRVEGQQIWGVLHPAAIMILLWIQPYMPKCESPAFLPCSMCSSSKHISAGLPVWFIRSMSGGARQQSHSSMHCRLMESVNWVWFSLCFYLASVFFSHWKRIFLASQCPCDSYFFPYGWLSEAVHCMVGNR